MIYRGECYSQVILDGEKSGTVEPSCCCCESAEGCSSSELCWEGWTQPALQADTDWEHHPIPAALLTTFQRVHIATEGLPRSTASQFPHQESAGHAQTGSQRVWQFPVHVTPLGSEQEQLWKLFTFQQLPVPWAWLIFYCSTKPLLFLTACSHGTAVTDIKENPGRFSAFVCWQDDEHDLALVLLMIDGTLIKR